MALIIEPANGLINGSNKVFSTSVPYKKDTIHHFINGQLHRRTDDDGLDQPVVQEGTVFISPGVVTLKQTPVVGEVVQLVYDNGQEITPLIVEALTGTLITAGVNYKNRLTVSRGNSGSYVFRLVNQDGVAVPLSNVTARFLVKARETDVDSAALISKSSAVPAEITFTNAPGGEMTVYLTVEDTNKLTIWVNYVYELRLTTILSDTYTLIMDVLSVAA